MVGHAAQQVQPLAVWQLVDIFRLTAHRYQMDVLRQQVYGLHSHLQILALLNGAYVQHEALGQLIAFLHLRLLLGCDVRREAWRKALVDDADAVGIFFATQLQDVLFRAFADGYDMVSFLQCLTEFPFVDFRVYPVVVFRMTHEDKVVDGHDALDAGFLQSGRQLAAQSVIHLHTVAEQVFHNTT